MYVCMYNVVCFINRCRVLNIVKHIQNVMGKLLSKLSLIKFVQRNLHFFQLQPPDDCVIS